MEGKYRFLGIRSEDFPDNKAVERIRFLQKDGLITRQALRTDDEVYDMLFDWGKMTMSLKLLPGVEPMLTK